MIIFRDGTFYITKFASHKQKLLEEKAM